MNALSDAIAAIIERADADGGSLEDQAYDAVAELDLEGQAALAAAAVRDMEPGGPAIGGLMDALVAVVVEETARRVRSAGPVEDPRAERWLAGETTGPLAGDFLPR